MPRKEVDLVERHCEYCDNIFKVKPYKKKRFCNHSCSSKLKNKGRKHTKEHNIKISKALKGENNPFYGKKLSKEHIEKRSKTGIERGSWRGSRNHMTGNGYKVAGENNPFYGHTHTEETKHHLSEIHCQLIADGKLNTVENMRGRKGWYYSNKNKTKFYYDSLLERYRMEQLDDDKEIINWTKRHGIKIEYNKGGKKRFYVPDFLIENADGTKILEEVKGYDIYAEQKQSALIKYCKKHNIKYNWLNQQDLKGYKVWKKKHLETCS